jgi:hypothetical protein
LRRQQAGFVQRAVTRPSQRRDSRKEFVVDNGFFEGIDLQETELSTGKRIRLPVRYFDWTGIMAHFPASAAEVRKLLPGDRLKPALLAPGIGVVSLAAMEYRRISDVAAYNEFVISVPALYEPRINLPGLPLLYPHRFDNFGSYIHHMPVTTQEAYDFGVELWGYRKFLSEITFEDGARALHCRLRVEGLKVADFEVDHRATKAGPQDFYTFTIKDGQLLRTRVQVYGQYGKARFQGRASFTLGDHPIAEELRSLGIRPKPVEVFFAPRVQSLLHPASQRLPM